MSAELKFYRKAIEINFKFVQNWNSIRNFMENL